jgi:hypothetical protein
LPCRMAVKQNDEQKRQRVEKMRQIGRYIWIFVAWVYRHFTYNHSPAISLSWRRDPFYSSITYITSFRIVALEREHKKGTGGLECLILGEKNYHFPCWLIVTVPTNELFFFLCYPVVATFWWQSWQHLSCFLLINE